MINDNGFKFLINDIFHFQSGETVFVGIVEEGPNFISSGEVVLMMDGNVRQTIKLVGEMIACQRNSYEDGLRSISIREKVDLTRTEIKDHKFYLCSK